MYLTKSNVLTDQKGRNDVQVTKMQQAMYERLTEWLK